MNPSCSVVKTQARCQTQHFFDTQSVHHQNYCQVGYALRSCTSHVYMLVCARECTCTQHSTSLFRFAPAQKHTTPDGIVAGTQKNRSPAASFVMKPTYFFLCSNGTHLLYVHLAPASKTADPQLPDRVCKRKQICVDLGKAHRCDGALAGIQDMADACV